MLDRDAGAPAKHPAPVLWFLTESHRGLDYLFATAAVMLLRALDYPSRVCLGYYAAPAAYDPETAHTPVTASDLHVWPEVLFSDGHWLVAEPTPGYDVLGPNFPWSGRLLNALVAIAGWAWGHAVELVAFVAGLITTWVYRLELLDALSVGLWAWFPGGTWRDRVFHAVAVLERRGRWSGTPRKPRQTIVGWLGGKRPGGPDADLERLARMAEWAAYAPHLPPPWRDAEVLEVCRHALGERTLRRWRASNALATLGVRP